MVTSVNGNAPAALQARESALANRPSQANTQSGDSAVAGRDPAVVYAGSAGTPSLSAVLSAQDSLNRAAGVSDVAIGGGQTIAQLLTTLSEKAASAQTAGSDQKDGLNADYQKVLQTIDQIAQSASAARDVQTFCPVSRQPPSARTARVRSEARSDPASGSENSWHQEISPRKVGQTKRSRCSSVP